MRELAEYLSGSHPVMWVSMSRKLIFLKNPKTGSRSMLKVLQDLCGDMKPKKFKDGKLTGEVGEWLKKVDDKTLSGFWIFTMARNPWDRVVSCYHYLRDVEKMIDMTFEEFVYGIQSGAHNQKIMDHLVPQSAYFMHSGRVFADYVGRLEHLSLTCKRVKAACGYWKGELPVINKSKHRPFEEYYTEETAKLIGEYYREDFELLNYSFPISSWVDTSNKWVRVSRLGL